MTNLRLTNAAVVLPDRVLVQGTIRVEDGRIAAVEAGPVSSATKTAKIIDAEGAYLIPGSSISTTTISNSRSTPRSTPVFRSTSRLRRWKGGSPAPA
jgi:alpha-D-ribose 1-methylphosphonate 5-triphosphate diphosphatase PhnM